MTVEGALLLLVWAAALVAVLGDGLVAALLFAAFVAVAASVLARAWRRGRA